MRRVHVASSVVWIPGWCRSENVRHARTSSLEALYEGYLNWFHLTRSPRETDVRMILERGINPVAHLRAVDGPEARGRHPVQPLEGRLGGHSMA